MRNTLDSHIERMEIDELVSRGIVLLGGLFWSLVAVVAVGIGSTEMAIVTAVIALALFGIEAIGWFYERTAGALLIACAAATAVYGVAMAWEASIWIIMLATMILPLLFASALFFLAGHEEEVVERAERGVPLRGAHA